MYKECKDYLIRLLKEAGMERKPFTSMKKLKVSSEIRLSAVLFQNEKITKHKQKRIFEMDDGSTRKRRKYYSREMEFRIIIGDASDEAVEEIFEKLLLAFEDGFYINGNYVEIIPENSDWCEEDDSIIRAKCAVELTVRFIGGIYKDYGLKPIKNITTTTERSGYGISNE